MDDLDSDDSVISTVRSSLGSQASAGVSEVTPDWLQEAVNLAYGQRPVSMINNEQDLSGFEDQLAGDLQTEGRSGIINEPEGVTGSIIGGINMRNRMNGMANILGHGGVQFSQSLQEHMQNVEVAKTSIKEAGEQSSLQYINTIERHNLQSANTQLDDVQRGQHVQYAIEFGDKGKKIAEMLDYFGVVVEATTDARKAAESDPTNTDLNPNGLNEITESHVQSITDVVQNFQRNPLDNDLFQLLTQLYNDTRSQLSPGIASEADLVIDGHVKLKQEAAEKAAQQAQAAQQENSSTKEQHQPGVSMADIVNVVAENYGVADGSADAPKSNEQKVAGLLRGNKLVRSDKALLHEDDREAEPLLKREGVGLDKKQLDWIAKSDKSELSAQKLDETRAFKAEVEYSKVQKQHDVDKKAGANKALLGGVANFFKNPVIWGGLAMIGAAAAVAFSGGLALPVAIGVGASLAFAGTVTAALGINSTKNTNFQQRDIRKMGNVVDALGKKEQHLDLNGEHLDKQVEKDRNTRAKISATKKFDKSLENASKDAKISAEKLFCEDKDNQTNLYVKDGTGKDAPNKLLRGYEAAKKRFSELSGEQQLAQLDVYANKEGPAQQNASSAIEALNGKVNDATVRFKSELSELNVDSSIISGLVEATANRSKQDKKLESLAGGKESRLAVKDSAFYAPSAEVPPIAMEEHGFNGRGGYGAAPVQSSAYR